MMCVAEAGIFAHGAADAPGPELEAEGDQAGAEEPAGPASAVPSCIAAAAYAPCSVARHLTDLQGITTTASSLPSKICCGPSETKTT